MSEELIGSEFQRTHDFAALQSEVRKALDQSDFERLHSLVCNIPSPALANVIRGFPIDRQVIVFRMLNQNVAASAFEYLSLEEQRVLLKGMGREGTAKILNDMSADDRTTLFEELPASVTKQLLALLSPEELSVAVKLLGYPEGSVGRLMSPHYIEIKKEMTVREVLDFVRLHGKDSETLNVLYVTDQEGRLIDDIRIREFLLAPTETLVSRLMDYRYVHLSAADSQDKAVQIFKDEDRKALPVVDSSGHLIGIVTIDDVLNVAETEATKDIQRIGGTEALDEPYMKIALMRMVKKRAGWLVILFLGEMLTATAMGFFEGEIKKAVVLALFVP